MQPMISQAYEAILQMERLTGAKLFNRASLIQDFEAGNSDLANELEQFNSQVTELHSRIGSVDLDTLKERLIHIRIHAMNIENEFSRLAESIQQAFVSTKRHDG